MIKPFSRNQIPTDSVGLVSDAGVPVLIPAALLAGPNTSSGLQTMPAYAVSSTSSTITTGTMRVSYVEADITRDVNNINVVCGTVAGASLTLCRIGLYEEYGSGTMQLIASTANNTSLLTAASTLYTAALNKTVRLYRGRRYAVGVCAVGTTAPSIMGVSANATMLAVAPRLGGVINASDLPTSFTDAGLSNSGVFFWAKIS